MKAVISSTYDDQYLFFLPIVTWCWNKLGVDVICFLPENVSTTTYAKYKLVIETSERLRFEKYKFNCPNHKEATYAQCARLYSGCLDLLSHEQVVVSDIDMALFKMPEHKEGCFSVFGNDLVPEKQYPMCYLTASHIDWWETFGCADKTIQQCLDNLLGEIEADHFRGNYWGKDQEEAYKKISVNENKFLINRARPGTQFASNRVDRDDINWRSYVNEELIDAHLWRPGYEENNFANIIELLQMKYPQENFQWLIEYRENYLKLLNS